MTSGNDNSKLTSEAEIAEVIRAAGPRPVPSEEAYHQVLAAATDTWHRKVRRRRQQHWITGIAATAAAIGLGLGVWFNLGGTPATTIGTVAVVRGDVEILNGDSGWQPLVKQAAIVSHSEMRTLVDAGSSLRLSTGVELRVAANTQLALLSANEIELKAGRIYIDSDRFSVGSDLRLFTPFGEVRDIGTQFQVDVDSNQLQVRVREGQISIRRAGLTNAEAMIGEQLNVDRTGHLQRRTFSTYDPEWSWAEGLASPFESQGRTLKELLNWVARETGYVLRFADNGTERISSTVLLGGHNEGLTPLEALDNHIGSAPQFDYEVSDGVISVFRR